MHCPTWQIPLQQADPSAHAAPGERQAHCPVASQVPLQQSDPVVHGDPVGIQHPPAPQVFEQQSSALVHAAPAARQAQCPVASHNPLQQSASVVHSEPFNKQFCKLLQRHWPLEVSRWQSKEPEGQLPPHEPAEERPHAGSGAQAHWNPKTPRTKTQPSLGPQPVQFAQICGVVDVVVVLLDVIVVVGQVPQSCAHVPQSSPREGSHVPFPQHAPQSCGHVPQSSEGPQSPSPHTQLHGGDPPVQLQRPAWQSEMRDFRHALPASFVRPLAAASSLHALGPQGGAAFATKARTPPPRTSTATPVSTFRATMRRPPTSAEPARFRRTTRSRPPAATRRRNTSFGRRRRSLTRVLPLSREEGPLGLCLA